jgi:MFS family permease
VNEEKENKRSVLLATSLSYVVVILDTTIVNIALAKIAASLGADVAGLQWVVNAYTLTFASLLLTGGLLGDRLGALRLRARPKDPRRGARHARRRRGAARALLAHVD